MCHQSKRFSLTSWLSSKLSWRGLILLTLSFSLHCTNKWSGKVAISMLPFIGLFAYYRFAVWIYFFMSLIGSQTMLSDPTTYIPIFLVSVINNKLFQMCHMNFQILKFIFFFGWLEVAEAIENPFGNVSKFPQSIYSYYISRK